MSEKLTRKLKDYVWELDGKKVSVLKRRTTEKFTFDKVRLMSFTKFAITCLDKMRIEESKTLRARIRKIKETHRKAGQQQRLIKS